MPGRGCWRLREWLTSGLSLELVARILEVHDSLSSGQLL